MTDQYTPESADSMDTTNEGALPFAKGNGDHGAMERLVFSQVTQLEKLHVLNTQADRAILTAFGGWASARVDILKQECELVAHWRCKAHKKKISIEEWKDKLADEASSRIGRGWSVTSIEARLKHAKDAEEDPTYWQALLGRQLTAKSMTVNIQKLLLPSEKHEKKKDATLPGILTDPSPPDNDDESDDDSHEREDESAQDVITLEAAASHLEKVDAVLDALGIGDAADPVGEAKKIKARLDELEAEVTRLRDYVEALEDDTIEQSDRLAKEKNTEIEKLRAEKEGVES